MRNVPPVLTAANAGVYISIHTRFRDLDAFRGRRYRCRIIESRIQIQTCRHHSIRHSIAGHTIRCWPAFASSRNPTAHACSGQATEVTMEVSRRTFIKATLAGSAGLSAFGFNLAPVYAQTQALKIERTSETRSTCPYCSVSCGVIIHTLSDKAKNATPQVVHVEGDPDHPINRGTLCPKGASLEQDILNERRLLKPQVRRPGSDHWEDIS